MDLDQDRARSSEEAAAAGVEVRLTDGYQRRRARTDDSGTFTFQGLDPKEYLVWAKVPDGFHVTDLVARGVSLPLPSTDQVAFGLAPGPAPAEVAAAETSQDELDWATVPWSEQLRDGAAASEAGADGGAGADGTANVAGALPEGEDGDQLMALRPVSLPLRFAPGRDTLEQLVRRTLPDGSIWLGVPFRSQIDGGEFQFVNCGPASLTMILAAFGLEVQPAEVRDYLNWQVNNFDTEMGTSLDSLVRIAREAGLTGMDLYSDRGGYRNWSLDAVRWHIAQGRPVIALTKYRLLPGHGNSTTSFEHYIVLTGLTPTGFIYNDASFGSTLGYGLEISNEQLERAWSEVSIPHNAVAFGLPDGAAALSFPERPRETPVRTTADPTSPAADAAESARGGTDVVGDRWFQDPRPAMPMASASSLLAPTGAPSTADLAGEAAVGDAPALAPSNLPLGADPPQTPGESVGEVRVESTAAARRIAGQSGVVLVAFWVVSLLGRMAARVAPLLRPGSRWRALAGALLSVLSQYR